MSEIGFGVMLVLTHMESSDLCYLLKRCGICYICLRSHTLNNAVIRLPAHYRIDSYGCDPDEDIIIQLPSSCLPFAIWDSSAEHAAIKATPRRIDDEPAVPEFE